MTTTLSIQKKIFSVINSSFLFVPKTKVLKQDPMLNKIDIFNDNIFMPDFQLEWCPNKNHYRVYILVASATHHKQNAGYCIMVIKSPMTASVFATIYKLIYSHRANNKGD